MIQVNLNQILQSKGRSIYWLAKETRLNYQNLRRLVAGQNFGGINRHTLNDLCRVLECQPGDILEYVPAPPTHSSN